MVGLISLVSLDCTRVFNICETVIFQKKADLDCSIGWSAIYIDSSLLDSDSAALLALLLAMACIALYFKDPDVF
jgi:hypothetical protein